MAELIGSARTTARWARPPSRRAPSTGPAVFVTGGGTGLGKAIAAEFARLGAAIVIASRKPEHLDAGRRGDRGPAAGRGRRVRHP